MQAFLYRHLVPAHELMITPVSDPPPLSFEVRIPKSGIIELPLGEEVRIALAGQIRPGLKGAQIHLDTPPAGFSFSKGWIGQKKPAPKTERGTAGGSIILKAEEPLKPGDQASLVLVAAVKKGREETLYPAPAIPVKVVAPHTEPPIAE
jgi:hypothetical protein